MFSNEWITTVQIDATSNDLSHVVLSEMILMNASKRTCQCH